MSRICRTYRGASALLIIAVAASHVANARDSVAADTPTLPPVATIAFSKPVADVNETVTLTYTISNPNATAALAGVTLYDQFPNGLATPAAAGIMSGCNGGVLNSQHGYTTLASGSLPAGGSCTYSVMILGELRGDYTNTTMPVTASIVGAGNAASASIHIGPQTTPPVATATFNPTVADVNEPVLLSLSVTNPNTITINGVQLFDTLPGGLTNVTTSGLSAGCNTGTVTNQSDYVTLVGGTITAGASCGLVLTIKGNTPGVYTNTTNAVTAALVGTGNAASAALTILQPGDRIFVARFD